MSNDDSTKRRYSEEEFALILRKASEIQERPGHRPGSREGLSLEEIQSIAREAGIHPDAISRAASLLGAAEWEEKAGLAAAIFGGPGKYHLDFEIPGRLPPEERGRILEVIRRVAEHQGEAKEVLGGVEWKTVGELSAINVNVSPRGDRTSIQIVGNRDAAGGVTFVFPMAGAAILVGALGGILEPTSAAGIISLITGLLGGGFILSRSLWVRGGKAFRKKLTRIMDALAGTVEEMALPPPGDEEEGIQ
ncbi:hypothetical protein ACFL3S_11965 [Gemmatimonadota bacterium]